MYRNENFVHRFKNVNPTNVEYIKSFVVTVLNITITIRLFQQSGAYNLLW